MTTPLLFTYLNYFQAVGQGNNRSDAKPHRTVSWSREEGRLEAAVREKRVLS